MSSSSSSLKSIAKSAREAIENGDSATALRLCETGLQLEAENYMLLVFRALALQNLGMTNEAMIAYQVAGAVQPKQLLAWQSLEYTKKLLNAYEQAGRIQSAIQLLEWLRSPQIQSRYCLEEGNELLPPKNQLLSKEIQLVEQVEELTISKEVETRRFRLGSDPLPILKEKVRNEVVSMSTLDILMLEWLSHERDLILAEKVLGRLLRKIPSQPDNKEALMSQLFQLVKEYHAESSLAQGIFLDFYWKSNNATLDFTTVDNWGMYGELSNYNELGEEELEEIAGKWPLSPFTTLVCTAYFWQREELGKAFKWLKRAFLQTETTSSNYGLDRSFTIFQIKRLEGLLYAKDKKYMEAIPLLLICLEKVDSDHQVRKILIDCYGELKEHQKAIELYHECLRDHPNDPTILTDLGWQYFLAGELLNAKRFLKMAQDSITTEEGESSTLLFRLGRVYWELDETFRRDKEVCLAYFLKAAKADPNQYESFLYLGYYYNQIEGDAGRAERCFTKALTINGDCLNAALELGQIWMATVNRKVDYKTDLLRQTVRVLEPFSSSNFRNSSLWIKLGEALAGLGRIGEATIAFQNGLKGDFPDQRRCLLGLAEGYRRQGRYTAAAKAYNRLLEIDPACYTASIGLAAVDADLCQYEEAQRKLSGVREKIPDCLKVFLKLEELRMSYSHSINLVKMGCTFEALTVINSILSSCKEILLLPLPEKGQGRSSTTEEEASLCLSRISLADNDMSNNYQLICWKLLGDVCMSLWTLRRNQHIFSLPLNETLSLIEKKFSDNEIWQGISTTLSNNQQIDLVGVIKISASCQLNLIIESDSELVVANAWTDLATVLLVSSGKAKDLLAIAIDCAEQAISFAIAPTEAWVILGVAQLKMDEYALAQHYLIKALHHDPNHSTAWLSLAHLYEILGDTELSKLALSRVQVGTDNVPAWFYEAYLAKKAGEEARLGSLLTQASELSKAQDHTVHMLAIVTQLTSSKPVVQCETKGEKGERFVGSGGGEEGGRPWGNAKGEREMRIRTSLIRRIAFYSKDKVALSILRLMDRSSSDQIQTTVTVTDDDPLVQDIIATLDSEEIPQKDILQTMLKTLNEGKANSAIVFWLRSFISYLLGDPLEAFSIQLSHLDQTLYDESAWEDAKFFYEKALEYSLSKVEVEVEELTKDMMELLPVQSLAEEWLRMRITPEIAERLVSYSACSAIITLWGPKIPGEILTVLRNSERFLLDFSHNH